MGDVARYATASHFAARIVLELFLLLRFRAQSLTTCLRVENFRITLHPGVVNRDTLEAPFLPVAHQLAIIAVHQERILRPASRTFPRHEMLRHDIRIKRGRIIFSDFDLEIAGGVAGIERPEKRKKSIHDGLAAGQFGELEPQLAARGPEIEEAIFRESRRQRISITVIETEGVAM